MNLLIMASGLFKWRSFEEGEISLTGPRVDLIQDDNDEFCKIYDVYGAFKLDYIGTRIGEVTVKDIDYWPWDAIGFDGTKLGDPVELPEEMCLKPENGNILSFRGFDDDFVIEISTSKEQPPKPQA